MRVQGVTGDLPAVAHVGPVVPPVVPPVDDAPPRPAVAATPAGEGADLGHGGSADDHKRRPLQPLPSFDPPLIAQRAVLGLPVGMLVLERAQATHTSYSAVWAEVDRVVATLDGPSGWEPVTGA